VLARPEFRRLPPRLPSESQTDPVDMGTATQLIGGTAGLALSAFGVGMLVTGRAPAPTTRSFRTVKEAGAYHLLFGAALLFVVIGTTVAGGVLPAVTAIMAILLVGTAIVRFRPRGRRHTSR
jgi:hypothetical protein